MSGALMLIRLSKQRWKILEYDYPKFHLSMDCFWAEIVNGQPELKEAEAAGWLSRDELDSVKWLPADQILVEKIKNIVT